MEQGRGGQRDRLVWCSCGLLGQTGSHIQRSLGRVCSSHVHVSKLSTSCRENLSVRAFLRRREDVSNADIEDSLRLLKRVFGKQLDAAAASGHQLVALGEALCWAHAGTSLAVVTVQQQPC